MDTIDLGQCDYKYAMELQSNYVKLRQQNKIPDLLLLVEHPPVITLGTAADKNNIIASNDTIKKEGIEIFESNRGGDVTYHGPGQQIAYPILDLSNYKLDIITYIRQLEEVLINVLFNFDIVAHRMEKYTGVWVGKSKIAAIGISVSKMITMHGMALNVDPIMKHFSYIIPCGIREYSVTSMANITCNYVRKDLVKHQIIKSFTAIFDPAISRTSI